MIPGEDSTREKPTPKNLALPVPSRKKIIHPNSKLFQHNFWRTYKINIKQKK
jgi:hypothetical protein